MRSERYGRTISGAGAAQGEQPGSTKNTYFVRSIRLDAESIASVLARNTVATTSAFSKGLLVSQCVTSAICISAIRSATNDRGRSDREPPVLAARRGSIKG